MMAAVAPAQLGSRLEAKDVNMDGSDIDAEGEDDVDIAYEAKIPSVATMNATVEGDGDEKEDQGLDEEGGDVEDSDTNQSESSETEGEDDDEDDVEREDENDGVVGAVKLPADMELDGAADSAEISSSDEENESRDGKESDGSEVSNSSDDAVAVEGWDGVSAGEAETDTAARNNCVFCKQDEDDDPSDEFEEYLSCVVCGDNAHRQCARSASSLLSEDEAKSWRCPQCVSNSLVPEPEDDKVSLARRLSTSSSRLTRDLLPATRGTPKPGSHSIFSTLIVEDDPLDGSRALRKRKSSSESREVQSTTSSKRRKKTSNETLSSGSGSSSVVDVNESKDNIESSSQRRESRTSDKGKQSIVEATPRPSRPRRQKPEAPRVRPLIRESHRLIISIKVDLSQIKEKPPKKSRRPITTATGHARFAASNTMNYSTPFYSLHDRDADESKIKPYGGILNETEADTSKTFPTPFDRARFEDARQKAEEEWKIKTAASEAEQETKGRSSQKISGPPSKIKCINFGGYEIDTWYAAPYPEEYSRNRVLYICEFCLKYMPSDYVAWRHKLKCPAKHPPGDEIYRDKSVSIFEVDGRKNPVYCQNLCLLAKLFLGSKTLYYDVEPFLFYIMTEYDDLGYHFVGYFSKEKRPSSMNNVSCILTLPIHQRKGYGNLLIDFSYLLTRVEKKTGSPEKPLSDMGLVSYRNYWRLVLAYTFLEHTEPISINKISDVTGMTADDIIAALEALRALVRDPVSKTYALRIDRAYLKETIEKWEGKGYVKLNPDALVWTPYIMGHYNLTNYDRGAISTVAPREDEDEQAAIPEEGVQQQAAGGPSMKVNGTAETIVIPTAGIDPGLDPVLAAPIESSSAPDLPAGPSSPPKANGVYQDQGAPSTPVKAPSPIPPTRYEIYPPIPGTISRRRTNKSGTRKTTYTPGSLSIRRDRTVNGAGSPRTNGISPRHITTPTSRKTRSALGKELEEAKVEAAKSVAEEGESSGKGKSNADDHQDQVNGQKTEDDGDSHSGHSSSESDSDIDANAEGDIDPAAEDDDESDEAEAEPELEHDISAGEDDEDFEPDGDGDVDEDAEGEDDEEDEHDADADADADVDAEADGDVEVDAEDDEDGPEGESEDAGGEEEEDDDEDEDDDGDEEHQGEEDEEDEDNGSEDAEGESDPGDDVAMVDA